VRERFAALLGCPAEAVFDVVAQRIGQGLEERPEKKPEAPALLDRYEQLIEVTRLAGRVQVAFDLYWDGLGSYAHLGWKLGEYGRDYRILRGFLPASGDPKGFGTGLRDQDQSVGLNGLALTGRRLGRLHESADLRREHDARKRARGEPRRTSIGLRNTCEVTLDLGHLGEALASASEALEQAEQAMDDDQREYSLANRATAHHRLGDIAAARADFAAATALEHKPMLYSIRGQWHARHHLDLGQPDACRAIAEAGIRIAQRDEYNIEIPGWQALFARLALAQAQDPGGAIDEIRAWTARSGDMQWIIEAHHLAARAALARGDLAGAQAEVDDGMRQARLCGYRLRLIELLVTESAIELARPDPGLALAAAREALDLATAPACRDAWGEADAAHAWGLAFEALVEREHAQRAFQQALTVRERIEHPQAEATRAALKRVA
jgi:tetratricopeptide (TPR) repeat protein